MLRHLSTSLSDQLSVRVYLSSGPYLDGVVSSIADGEVELRHADGSRSAVVLAHIVATTIK